MKFLIGVTIGAVAGLAVATLYFPSHSVGGRSYAEFKLAGEDGDIPERKGPTLAEMNYKKMLEDRRRCGDNCQPVAHEIYDGPTYLERRACERRIGRPLMTQDLPRECR